jgi:quercetin dioxygenase-like cupin family protein
MHSKGNIMTKTENQIQGQPQQAIISDLVKYQSGSVVSRVILKEINGSVTVFAFSAGEELSAHSTPFSAIVYILEGNAEVIIGENKNILRSGEIITLPKNIRHAIKGITDFKMLLLMVK